MKDRAEVRSNSDSEEAEVLKMVDRRGFLVHAARGAALGGAYLAFGDVADGLARSRLLCWTGGITTDDEFTLLVIGDSVLWGQGLREEVKFSHLVAQWIKSHFPGRMVSSHRYAHSGAVIQPDAQKDARPPTHGEVPNGYPSITYQVSQAGTSLTAEKVNLVLMGGGISDVTLKVILSTDPAITDKVGLIRELTRKHCASGLRVLLPQVLQTFSRAKVVLTSYFPIVSGQTDPNQLTSLVNLYNPTRTLSGPAPEAIRKALSEQSRAFHEEYVSTVRLVALGAQALRTGGTEQRRTAFAVVPFASQNCYGAQESWLWRIGEPDQVTYSRKLQCQAAGLPSSAIPQCFEAPAGHPNVSGAAAYARAIIGELQAFLPDWQPGRQPAASKDVAPPRVALPPRITPLRR